MRKILGLLPQCGMMLSVQKFSLTVYLLAETVSPAVCAVLSFLTSQFHLFGGAILQRSGSQVKFFIS